MAKRIFQDYSHESMGDEGPAERAVKYLMATAAILATSVIIGGGYYFYSHSEIFSQTNATPSQIESRITERI